MNAIADRMNAMPASNKSHREDSVFHRASHECHRESSECHARIE